MVAVQVDLGLVRVRVIGNSGVSHRPVGVVGDGLVHEAFDLSHG